METVGGLPWPKGIKVCHFVECPDGKGHWLVTAASTLQPCNELRLKDLVDSCGKKPGERLARDLL